uniref:Uncharacterized protein n=1 Tax=viral metagenome TaxID=1070528 RepID=A0A6C0C766_9ZZZZ
MEASSEIKYLSTKSKQWAIQSGQTPHIFNVLGDPSELGKAIRDVRKDQIEITIIFLELKSESNTVCIGLEGIRINSDGKIIDLVPAIKKRKEISEEGNIVYISYAINLDTLTKNINDIMKKSRTENG